MAFHFDPKTHCQNIRCKEMYSQAPRDQRWEEEMAEYYGSYDTTVFWCQLTQAGRGPDGERVDSGLCLRGRNCFINVDELT